MFRMVLAHDEDLRFHELGARLGLGSSPNGSTLQA